MQNYDSSKNMGINNVYSKLLSERVTGTDL